MKCYICKEENEVLYEMLMVRALRGKGICGKCGPRHSNKWKKYMTIGERIKDLFNIM